MMLQAQLLLLTIVTIKVSLKRGTIHSLQLKLKTTKRAAILILSNKKFTQLQFVSSLDTMMHYSSE